MVTLAKMFRAATMLVCVLMAVSAQAQETRGNINGVVRDLDGVIPGAVVRITNTGTSQTQQRVTNSSGYFEAVLLNPGAYEVRVELPGYKTLSQTGISLAVGQTVNLSLTLEVGHGQRADRRRGRSAAARCDDRLVGPQLRSADGRRAADVLEHADHAVALHARRRAGRGRSAEHLPGVHGRHDERGGRPGRHGERLRQSQHRQQLHDRRRHEQRLRPPHRHLAQLRSDRGNADRDVELRRVAGVRHGTLRLDDDARRHEHAARLCELHALEQSVELAEHPAEGPVQGGPSGGRRVPQGTLAHRCLHARRPDRHPRSDRRARQGVLLCELFQVGRLGAGPACRQLHRAGKLEAPRGGLL